jgi:di/tricarboxylate transporter
MPDLHLIATFVIIAATIIAYASERWPMETVSLVSLAADAAAVWSVSLYRRRRQITRTVEQLLAGFANPALATVIALLIVGQGLFATDAMEAPARKLGQDGRSGRHFDRSCSF